MILAHLDFTSRYADEYPGDPFGYGDMPDNCIIHTDENGYDWLYLLFDDEAAIIQWMRDYADAYGHGGRYVIDVNRCYGGDLRIEVYNDYRE